MLGIHKYGNAFWLKRILNGGRNLSCHGLLSLKPAGKAVQHPCQLGNTDNPAVRHIGDMSPPQNRHHVMFTMRLHRDIPQHHHIIIAFHLFKGAGQHLFRVIMIT